MFKHREVRIGSRALLIMATAFIASTLYCPKSEGDVFDFTVVGRDDSIRTYNAPPPAIVYFHLTIRNIGSEADSYSINLGDYVVSPGWRLEFCDGRG